MKKFPLTLGIILSSLLVLTACANSPAGQQTNTSMPGTLASTNELTYDWGDIDINGGEVSHTFMFQNTGEGPVQFTTATTSCMCTTASIELSNGKKSPEFGMHGNATWGEGIAPNETATVTVIFDPMAHGPSATGPISRSIFINTTANADGKIVKTSTDSAENILTLKVSANVLSTREQLQ